MSFLSFLKKKEETSLLIDIGNGSISCALVLFAKNSKPRFLYSIAAPIVISKEPDSLQMSKDMANTLSFLLKDTLKKNHNISRVVISFSSPWFVLKTKEIHIEKDTTFVVNELFIDDITKKEAELFKRELAEEFHVKSPEAFEVIEKSLIDSKINGYNVERIIGQRTKVFDASIFISIIAKNIKEKIVDIILKNTHLSNDRVIIHSFSLILFSMVRTSFTTDSDFILMDITSELTDIILVENDVIKKTAGFPFGRNSIIRQMIKIFNIGREIAESELSMYVSDKLDSINSNLIRKLLQNLEREWAIYLEEILISLSPDMVLPKKVFITADSDVAPVFLEFMKLSKTDATADFRKNININHINREILSDFYQTDYKMAENEFVVILALFVDKSFL